MNPRRTLLLIGCSMLSLLPVACGGDPPGMGLGANASAEARSAAGGGEDRAQPYPSAPAVAAVATSTPGPRSSELSDGPPRFNPDGIPASQIETRFARFENAPADEASCWTKEEPCDGDFLADLNQKSHGHVGWWTKTGRDVFVDTVDVVRLPSVAGAVTVFVKNHSSSKDMLDVTLEDRSGNKLHSLPPLAVGASAAIGWTRTKDPAAGPYRLRLSARVGPGEHTVDYTVLPIAHVHWSAAVQGQQIARQ